MMSSFDINYFADVFDVYIKNPEDVVIVDFGPYGPTTDGLLFKWDEIIDGNLATNETTGDSADGNVIVYTLFHKSNLY